MGLNSAIYEGTVRHRRFVEVEREFTYRIFMLYLDLSEVGEVMSLHPLWSTRPRTPVGFRRSDYLGSSDRPLDECVRDLVRERTGKRPGGPVRMLTSLRYFGLLENPATFYYCFAPDGRGLETVVAEVTNTPWGDRHAYVIGGGNSGKMVSARLEKAMHVSPLMPIDQTYELRFAVPGPTLPVHIASEREGKPALDATLSLARTEFARRSMSRVLATYPPMSYRATWGIYRQAVISWARGARFHPRTVPGGEAAAESAAAEARCPASA
jgi:uncharacterized protein